MIREDLGRYWGEGKESGKNMAFGKMKEKVKDKNVKGTWKRFRRRGDVMVCPLGARVVCVCEKCRPQQVWSMGEGKFG